jgi:hypothetical protein
MTEADCPPLFSLVHGGEAAPSLSKHVISVGFDVPGEVCESVGFDSDTSLLDADIIVFSPNLEEYTVDCDYLGKNCLTKESSGRLQIVSAHWKRELQVAIEAGKTVFVLMLGVESLYIHTGQRTYSGTGRNARVTDHVDVFDPYSLGDHFKNGQQISVFKTGQRKVPGT